MPVTLAFDVFETLLDAHGVVVELESIVGERARDFSQAWRQKQLEYTFRRALMRRYEDFTVCTRQSLRFTCTGFEVTLSHAEERRLLDSYRRLPPFNDVAGGLEQLRSAGLAMHAFSNGRQVEVRELLNNAGISGYFQGVVSADDVRSFKPDPAVYQHFLSVAGCDADEAWLISSNPFDVIGAKSAGLHAAWVRRTEEAVFDPWDLGPDLVVASLEELAPALA